MPTATRPRCAICGEALSVVVRSDARTCGTRCRKALSRIGQQERAAQAEAECSANIPDELTRRPRWVRHAAKRPMRLDGKWASVIDPSTWSDFKSVARSDVGEGLGYVLAFCDRMVVVDLDHAVVGGEVLPWAQSIIDALPATYMERGRSGTGLHLWFRGEVPAGRRIRRGDLAVEVYSDRRYIIVGERLPGAPLELAELPDAAGLIASLT